MSGADGVGRGADDKGSMPATNASWYERGLAHIPGGVNSPVRAFRSVGGTPYFVARGQGAHVWDVEGTRFVDYVQSYGASILGHAHPVVIEAVQRAATHGTVRRRRARCAWPRSCARGCRPWSRCV